METSTMKLGRASPFILNTWAISMGADFYHIIGEHAVFVSFERSRILNETLIADRDFMWKHNVYARDGRERQECRGLERDYLLGLLADDPVAFRANWVDFDLSGEPLRNNAFRLLDAFVSASRLQKQMFFRDTRESRGLRDLFEPEHDDRWPYGKDYRIVLFSQTGWWRSRVFSFECDIETDRLTRAFGTLQGFTFSTELHDIRFDVNSVCVRPTL